jgi:P27 family predicted phage terminase small subunit
MTAAAGRKSRPAKLKLVEGRGNGKDQAGRAIIEPPPFVRLPPEAPEWLGDEARELWEKTVPELARLELLKPVDGPALTAYCLAWQRLRQAQQMIDESEFGILSMTSQGMGRNPAVIVLEAASKELRAWASEFGLTPAAESKLGARDGGSAADDPFS